MIGYALKALLPIIGIMAMLIATRKRGLSWREDLGLRAPRIAPALLWLAAWVVLVSVEERVNPSPPALWPEVNVLRIIALGLTGPVAEELAFRGVLFGVLARRGWRMPLIIAVTAASWALLHVRYDPVQIGFIALDGVALGAARAHTRSLFVPLAMHVGANLFSISQSLGLWAAP